MDLVRNLKIKHITNFRNSEKLASIVVKMDKILDEDISCLLNQSEVNLEFVVVYSADDAKLIDKHADECRLVLSMPMISINIKII